MALDGTYETKLLRILIGFFHVSTLQTLALGHHGKTFETLTQEEKNALEADMLAAVMRIAHQVSAEALQGELKSPPVVH